MPHTDVTPTSASIASTGPGIRYIGQHCYAYSGIHDLSSKATGALEFTSGSGYIIGKFEYNADFATAGGASLAVEIFFNGIQTVKERDVGNNYLAGDCYFDVLIPPLTKVRVDLTGGGADANINFVGRVYGAV